ncbi:ERF family protein [Laceyella putida]|uniref:ERF family protein n=1 Tax=Laceyella putida TaxID=110101 RepID=A0ABW2RR19_9BACL
MQMSQSIAQIAGALSKFQGEVTNPSKTKTAIIPPKDPKKQGYKYKYADLGDIIDTIREPLKKHGLSYIQNPVRNDKGDLEGVYTMILHESGEYMIFDLVPIRAGANATPQQIGSALTYARRYSLSLALGIAADEDDDASAAEHGGNQNAGTTQKSSVKKTSAKQQTQRSNQPAATKQGNGELDAYKELAEQNQQPQETKATNQRGRFFAVAAKRGLQERAQKAIVFGFTGKESRKEVTDEEFKVIADFLDGATNEEIKRAIDDAVKAKTGQKQLDTSDPTDDEIMKLLGEGAA